MDILLAIFLIVCGVSIAFIGLQMFFVILPLVGLVAGFYLGAELVAAIFGDGFLSTVAGWIVGIVVGLAFAAIARMWWYAGVLLSSGLVGSLIFTGIGEAAGVSNGVVFAILAIAGSLIFVIVTMMLDLPIYTVIVNTAVSGAAIAVAGIMLMFDRISREDLAEGAAVAAIQESWVWVMAWVVLAAVGIVRQLPLKERITMPVQRWSPAS